MHYKYEEIKEYFHEWEQETSHHQGTWWIVENIDDLHHHAFNTDYYIIGTARAIEWMGTKASVQRINSGQHRAGYLVAESAVVRAEES